MPAAVYAQRTVTVTREPSKVGWWADRMLICPEGHTARTKQGRRDTMSWSTAPEGPRTPSRKLCSGKVGKRPQTSGYSYAAANDPRRPHRSATHRRNRKYLAPWHRATQLSRHTLCPRNGRLSWASTPGCTRNLATVDYPRPVHQDIRTLRK